MQIISMICLWDTVSRANWALQGGYRLVLDVYASQVCFSVNL